MKCFNLPRAAGALLLALVLLSATACTNVEPPSPQTLYVANYNAGVQVFLETASGDASPLGVIFGPNSTLLHPCGVAVDQAGTIWVAGDQALKAFPAGTTGDVAPVRTIAGSNTMLNNPDSIAFDSSGRLAVGSNGGSTLVLIFDGDSNGDVAPVSYFTIPPGGISTRGVAFDADDNLWVAATADDAVYQFSASSIAAASGPVAPIRTISGPLTQLSGPVGIAIDGTGRILVANASGDKVSIFAQGATGDVEPTVVIAGGNTGLENPFYLGLSNHGTFSVGAGMEHGPVVTFPCSTTGGDIAPLYRLSSPDFDYPFSTAYR